jgi:Zn-dependent metalloprotease
MRHTRGSRARAAACALALSTLLTATGPRARAQVESDDAPLKVGGPRLAAALAPDVETPVLDDVVAALDAVRRRGSIRHVRLRQSGRVNSLFGDLGALPRVSNKRATTEDAAPEAEDAVAFVEDVAPLVGTADAARDLALERRSAYSFGERITLRQVVGRYPVFDAHTAIDVAPDGRVFGLTNSFVPGVDATLATAEPALDAAAARSAALVALAVTPDRVRDDEFTAELGVAPVGAGRLAWRVVVPTRAPYGQWEVFVDAATGDRVGEPRDLVAFDGRAKLFVPNAVVTTGNASLSDDNNAASAVPESAYSAVDLQGLDASGLVAGPFVTTDRTTDRATAAGGDFTALRRDARGFDEVQAYWAIDTAQRYIQSTLGIANAANYQIHINVHWSPVDNSNYTPGGDGRGVLNFGDGGVDDAQDAEIVWHEYGHAVLDNQAQILVGSGEAGAIHEGWGDYMAATLSTTVPGDPRFYPTIGEWDASSYSSDVPPFLRRVDGSKQYPEDLDGEVHDDGELWSSVLWQLHQSLGRETADRIIFNANFLFPFSVGFEDAAAALVESDLRLNAGANAAQIQTALAAHGLATAPVIPGISSVKLKNAKLTIDGSAFETGGAVVEIDGTALGSLKYPKAYRRKGLSTRMTTKDARVGALARGVSVVVTVYNPVSGARSAPFTFTP